MRTRSTLQRIAALAAVLVLSSAPALAQTDTGTITGLVSDASGAAVAGASVQAVNQVNGLEYGTQSSATGNYVITALPIGTYDLTATSEGFQTLFRANLTISAGTRARVDIELQVGSVTETVEVTAELPLLESETSSLGQAIENTTITQMPLNGRNYQELAVLTAGVLPSRRQNFVEDAFSVNGAGFDQNVFTLDGADNNNYFSGVVVASNQAVKPSIDAIQEFKMETHNYGAEFGRGGGAIVQVTTKSGTNDYHGTAFEFLRNDKLDANDFFNSGRPQPPFRQNQFGATFGGPLVKDRMFFFGSYEGTRIREKLTRLSIIPTPEQVRGDFSGIAAIHDPASQSADGARIRFADDRLPASRIDPVSKQMVELYPAPNRAGRQNYLFNPSRNRDDDKVDGRFDWRVATNHTVFARFSHLNFDRLEPGNLPLPASGGNTAVRFSRAKTGVVNWTAAIGGSMVNEIRVAYNRLVGGIDTPTQSQLWKEFGFKGLFDREDINGLPDFRPSGYRTVGDRNFAPDPRKQDVRQIVESFSMTKGNHSLKMGVNIRNFVRWSGITNFARGRFWFNGQFTRAVAGVRGGGDGLADSMLGLTSNMRFSTPLNVRRHAYAYETYIQDNWKVTPKLSLNIGLRYEYQSPYVEQNDRAQNFIIDPDDARFGTLIPTGSGVEGRSFRKRDLNDWGPRIGLAYQVAPKTVIRAGYGIFYVGTFRLPVLADPTANPPFYLQNDIRTQVASATSQVVVRNGVPPDALNPDVIRGRSLVGVWPFNFRNGMTNQWNFNIQQSLPGNSLISLAYVGSNTVHTESSANLNQPEPGPGGINPRRWFPQFANVTTNPAIGGANYQGLEAKFERRFSGGFSVLSGYTWSKNLAKQLGQRTSYWHLAPEKTVSRQHLPQRVFFAGVWDLPFGKGRRFATQGPLASLIGGWQISPIFEAQRGLPLSPSVAGNPANTTGGQRPNRIADGNLPRAQRTPQRWFDVGAFEVPERFTFGNSAAWIIEGPGLVNLDMMVSRTFALSERLSLDFRTEFFNVFNEAHFNFPNGTINRPAGGRISSTMECCPARQVQFGMKLIF
ncbi:MAG: TonB-dependent receptor [Bryobacterales bacterium]|nr:TonB-dependent receptor [Bryobacterales bacterium]